MLKYHTHKQQSFIKLSTSIIIIRRGKDVVFLIEG